MIEGRPGRETTGVTEPFSALLEGAGEYRKTSTVRALRMEESFTVYTKTGEQTGEAGDYLVTDGREAWASPAAFFEDAYEPVDGLVVAATS